MGIVIQPFVFLAICLAVHFFVDNAPASSQSKEKELRMNKAYCVIGYVALAVLGILAIVLYFNSGIEVALIAVAFAILPTLLIIGYYGYRIVYDKSTIEVKMFAKIKSIKLKNVIAVENGMDLIVRTKDDTFTIHNYMTNITELYQFLLQNIKLSDEKQKIPMVRRFKDSIYRPNETIFAFILMGLLAFGLLAIIIWAYSIGSIRTRKDLFIGLSIVLFFATIFTIFITLSVISVKRAHSSKKWRKIAKLLIKEDYLKP